MPEPIHIAQLLSLVLARPRKPLVLPSFDALLASAMDQVAYNVESREAEQPVHHGGKRAARHS